MKGNTKHELRVSAVIVIAAAATGFLTYLIVYMPDNEYDQQNKAFRYSKSEEKTEATEPNEPDPNWADKMIAEDRKMVGHLRDCKNWFGKCTNALELSVSALEILETRHPKLRQEIAAILSKLQKADAGVDKISERCSGNE